MQRVYPELYRLQDRLGELIDAQRWSLALSIAQALLPLQERVYPPAFPLITVTACTISRLAALVYPEEGDERVSVAASRAAALARISHGEEAMVYRQARQLLCEVQAARSSCVRPGRIVECPDSDSDSASDSGNEED